MVPLLPRHFHLLQTLIESKTRKEYFVSKIQQIIYEVVKENRISKGKPMNMTWDEIHSTASVISTDFFLLKRGEEAIAGGIVYKAAEGIRYVPFWGDKPGYASQKPKNFLSHYIAEY